MGYIVTTRLDLSDYGTLCDLACITGNADYSFRAEQLLNTIGEYGFSEEFGRYFASELDKKNAEVLAIFDSHKIFDIWKFFDWLDKNDKKIRKALGIKNNE